MPEERENAGRQIERDLFVWKAPARPFKRRSRNFYITVFAIVGVVGLILFLAEGAMPVILLASLIFLYYVLNTVQPQVIEYKITNWGVKIAGTRTAWSQMTRFWFSERQGAYLLIFETLKIPNRLELVINKEDRKKIREVLSKYLNEEKTPPSNLDKITNWVARKLPEE